MSTFAYIEPGTDFSSHNPFTLTLPRVYNVPMPSPSQDRSSSVRHPRHHVYALETTGLLIIAAILLTIILVRSWYAIHWSLR